MNIYGKPVSLKDNGALLAVTLTILASVGAGAAQGQQAPVPGDLPIPASPSAAAAPVRASIAPAILQPAQTAQFDTAVDRPTPPPKKATAAVSKATGAADAENADNTDSAAQPPAAPAKSKWLTMPKMPKIKIPMYHYFPKDQDPGEMRDMTKDKDEPMHAPGMNGGTGGTTTSEASDYADGKRSSGSIMSGNDGSSSKVGTGHGAGAAVIDTDEETPYPIPANSRHGAKPASSVKKAMTPAPAEDDENDEPKPAHRESTEWRKKDPAIFYRKAVLLTKEKLYNEALIEINKCLQLNPHYVEARYQGAYISQLQGHFAEAIRHYEKIVETDPHHLQAHINLGVCYRHEKRLDEAEDEYRKAIEISFYSLQAHYNLANVLIEQNEFEGALKELKACSKIAPNNPSVHNNLGVIYQKRGYFEEAEEEFLRALTLEPANKSFERNLQSVRSLMKKKTVTS
ncbi:MAG: tetratricopeptide repeat protein [Candidatus Obscuribacterales bacterium]|nr:tetratricopeptide repeat protein [Candidatus Obscuribacterales bacterium]